MFYLHKKTKHNKCYYIYSKKNHIQIFECMKTKDNHCSRLQVHNHGYLRWKCLFKIVENQNDSTDNEKTYTKTRMAGKIKMAADCFLTYSSTSFQARRLRRWSQSAPWWWRPVGSCWRSGWACQSSRRRSCWRCPWPSCGQTVRSMLPPSWHRRTWRPWRIPDSSGWHRRPGSRIRKA